MSSAQSHQADDSPAVWNMRETSAAMDELEGNNGHGTAASMQVEDAVSIHRGVDIMKLSQGKVHRKRYEIYA